MKERSKAGLKDELRTAVAFLRQLEWGTEHQWCEFCCVFSDDVEYDEDGEPTDPSHKPGCELAAFLKRVSV